MKIKWKNLLLGVIGALFLSLTMVVLFPKDYDLYIVGFFILSSLSILTMIWLFRWAGGERFLAIIVSLAFLLRFGVGLFFTQALPLVGYPEEAQQAGYLFADAYQRDTQAWELAASDSSIFSAFSGETFFSDQYGGLLALSAVVYRVFSPGIHFKANILLLMAFMSTLTILFMWKALKQQSTFIQKTVVFLIAFYPDIILYSASEMREGIILGLSAILFYLVNKPTLKNLKTVIISLFVIFALILINLKVAIFIVFAIGVWYLLFNNQDFSFIKSKRWLTILIILGVIGIGLFSVQWLAKSSQWDSALLVMESGWVETIIHQIGKRYRLPFATMYGFFRPLLPAAIIETSIPIWKITTIIRSISWYMVMPVLLYGFVFGIRTFKKDKGKHLIFWVLIMVWILLSSLRAGGDQWDNPRYRINLFVLIAVYLAETLDYLILHKDHWFTRIVIAIFVFIAFFLYWYINRYINTFAQINFYIMVGLILISAVTLFISGLIHEYRIQKK
ncbi:MAG: hypothetical protein CL609_06795 [Anaerolineaceae bacterium]|nr:hypothetical protein [Anaerolineaceae bacterium]